jgi:hypothetical protein
MCERSLALTDFPIQTVLLVSLCRRHFIILHVAEAFVKLRKTTISLVMSFRLSHGTVRLGHVFPSVPWNSPAPTTRIFMNLIFDYASKMCRENSSFTANWHTAGRYAVLITSCYILLRMRNVSNKICRENQNTHFVFSNLFSKIVPFVRQE